jgi:type I restriction enzyme R subunit
MGFNEHALEMSIMEMFTDENYTHVRGDEIHREKSDVLLVDDLRLYLADRYAAEGITGNEIEGIILSLRAVSGSVYEANRAVFKLIANGFILNREDRTQKDFFVELIDFSVPENNIFKIVNQVEIQGYELRIPDGIVYVNGLPLVVLEFKSAVKENTTILNAYEQLTIRYKRDKWLFT